MSFQLSKKEIMREIVKCGKNPSYFISNYAKITHPQRGLIPFKLYDFQEELLDSFEDHRFKVILTPRQLGISTVSAAYIVWLMLFHREKNVLVIATKFSTASNLVMLANSPNKHGRGVKGNGILQPEATAAAPVNGLCAGYPPAHGRRSHQGIAHDMCPPAADTAWRSSLAARAR